MAPGRPKVCRKRARAEVSQSATSPVRQPIAPSVWADRELPTYPPQPMASPNSGALLRRTR
eukprot:11681961-Alexandrium_andersonii.AAC.1